MNWQDSHDQEKSMDPSSTKFADYHETLSSIALPSQQTTGPRCNHTDEQEWHTQNSKLYNWSPQTKGINRLRCIGGITHSYQAHNQDVLMVRNNPSQHCAVDGDLPMPQIQDQDQEQDIIMADAVGDGTPHGGQEQDIQQN